VVRPRTQLIFNPILPDCNHSRAVLVHPRACTHTGIRLTKSAGTPDDSDVDTSGMAKVANSLSKFCQ